MKTMFTVVFVAFLAITTSAVATDVHPTTITPAKPTSCFDYFRVHKQGPKDVTLSWAVNSSDIVSFEIQQSFDGFGFESVASEACGATGAHKTRIATHDPGTYYFRVKAVRADGTSECSPVETVRFIQHR